MEAEVDYQVAVPTELGTPNLRRAKIAQDSADRRMATKAAGLNGNRLTKRRSWKWALTSTGLLM